MKKVFQHALHDLTQPAKSVLPGLDFLRSLAILLVVSGHAYAEFVEKGGGELPIGSFPLFYFSWTGVDLFFVLSGFLIGRQLWRELTQDGAIDIPAFLLRRGLRIWPFYYIFVFFTFVVASKPFSEYFADLAFVSNYFHHSVGGGWSLSTEEQFYLLIPLLLSAANKWIPLRKHIVLLVIPIILLPIGRWITFMHHPGATAQITYTPFHAHSDGLFAGLILAWISIAHSSWMIPRPLHKNILIPCVLILVGALLRHFDRLVFAYTGLALIFSGATLFALRDQSLFTRFTKLRVFYVTSRLSYGMYLNHFLILDFLVSPFLALKLGGGNQYAQFTVMYFGVLLLSAALGVLGFILIESPFLQFRDKWLKRHKHASHRKLAPLNAPASNRSIQ